MENLDKLLAEAQQAQRAYDRAKEAQAKPEPKYKHGKVTATSNENGEFTWLCNATADQIIGHTISTIKAAADSLKSQGGSDTMLMLAIASYMATDMISEIQ